MYFVWIMQQSREEDFKRKNAFSLYELYGYMHVLPSTRTPATGVMKFTILEDYSLVIITIYLVCVNHALD